MEIEKDGLDQYMLLFFTLGAIRLYHCKIFLPLRENVPFRRIVYTRFTLELSTHKDHPQMYSCVLMQNLISTYEQVTLINNWASNTQLIIWTFLCIHLCMCMRCDVTVYRWTGGAIGRPGVLPLARAVLGPKRTCFCCVRCRSSICARSISKTTGARRMADELNTSHVAEHE